MAEWLTRKRGDAELAGADGRGPFRVVVPDVQDGRQTWRACSNRRIGAVLRRIRSAWTMPSFGSPPRSASRCSPTDGADADTLFKNAEAALKKAKASGERYLFYTQTMTETRRRQAHPGKSAAPGARQGRVRAPLPAQGEPRERQAHQRRGADPLERSAHGPGAAGPVHPDPGRNRIDP